MRWRSLRPRTPTGAVAFPFSNLGDPRAITTGPDGNLWTASSDLVFKISTAGVKLNEFGPFAGLSARGIARGGNGQLWVADASGSRAACSSFTTAGVPTPYPIGGHWCRRSPSAGPGTHMAHRQPGDDAPARGVAQPRRHAWLRRNVANMTDRVALHTLRFSIPA